MYIQPGAERLANEKITIIIVYIIALLHVVLCDQNKQKALLGEGKKRRISALALRLVII